MEGGNKIVLSLPLTSCVLIRVGDEFDERVVRVAVQVMSVPRFLSRDLYAGLVEHFGYGGGDLSEMSVVRVGIEERHLSTDGYNLLVLS